MTSKELLKGIEVDMSHLIDTFAEKVALHDPSVFTCLQVEHGAPLNFDTFKSVWKSMKFSFVLVAAASEEEIGSHVQDLFMCALDRFELPSPLKYGQYFGECHRPRLRRPCSTEKPLPTVSIALSEDEEEAFLEENEAVVTSTVGKKSFCDCFEQARDFPKADLERWIRFAERVAVIYVLYTVFREQCLEPRVYIHLPMDLLSAFVDFLPKLVQQNVLDAAFMFKKLWKENAFVIDVIRRPPGFLSLPLERSPAESNALRELAFHLKTSLNELKRTNAFEDGCAIYAESQNQLVRTNIGHKLDAERLITFNCDVGRWLSSVTAQEAEQVHHGITGMLSNTSQTKKRMPKHPSPLKISNPKKTTTVEKKRKRTKAVSGLEISDTDSWGMNTPGIPKIARLVMQRDRQRQKETTQRQNASHRSETIEAEELKTEDFFNAFSELEAYRSEHAQNTETVERLSGAFQRELLRLPNFEAPQISSTSENLESSLESPHTPSFHSDPKFEYSESTDLTDDEETRHLKQELLILKQELKDSPLSNCKDQTDS